MPPVQPSDHPINGNSRKRPREDPDEPSIPPCSQCPSRRVRCDRQQPDCSNCRRSGVPYEYSNSPSRAYNVKELLDAFCSVTARLDHEAGQPAEGTESATDDGDNERVPGSPAAMVLFSSLRSRLAHALDNPLEEPRTLWAAAVQSPAVKRTLERQLEIFPFNGGCLDVPNSSDNEAIQAPPRALAETCLRKCLSDLNVYVPILDKSCLNDAIDLYYNSPPCQRSSAQALIISNVCLLVITLSVRVDRANSSGPQLGDYNLEMVHVLLGNCNRALKDLGAFSKATLENLKTLLTLALVCQEYYSSHVYSRICHEATHLVKAIGLHQVPVPTSNSWETLSEEGRLFWTTYDLDKRLAFLNGQPSNVYLHDCSLPLYQCLTSTPTMHELDGAFITLLTIWEDIQLSLYSAPAQTAPPPLRTDHINRLRGVLSRWRHSHQNLLPGWLLAQSPHLKLPQLELQYAFYTTQLLITRCDTCLPQEQRYGESSHAALTLLTTNFHLDHMSPDKCRILGRIIRTYPLLAFHDFTLHTLLSGQTELAQNADLLCTARALLGPFCDTDFPGSYYNKIYAGLNWCTNQLDILMHSVGRSVSLTRGVCPELDEMGGSSLHILS
ncbi:hypothetical protein BDW62DRAFT_203425 [Aspergillus aurantiobrunneus]